MADGIGDLHEAPEQLRAETVDRHRAIISVIEELEAVDWYDQRADATGDPELRAILEHNRDEEKEHAVMALEWLRRRDPVLDRFLRQYLFSTASMTEPEDRQADGAGATDESDDGAGGLTGRGRGGCGVASAPSAPGVRIDPGP